jgi:hypothetical protein
MIGFLAGMAVVFLLNFCFSTDRQAGSIRRDVNRLERKLNLILKQMNIPFDAFEALSERVKALARDPNKKIEAIHVYREETGAELAEAKNAVEAYIQSL